MLAVIILAVVLYGLVPVAGAFIERRKWRFFRRRFHQLIRTPDLKYADSIKNELAGDYHLYGFLESTNRDNSIWIKNENLTVKANLETANIYIIPGTGGIDNPFVFDPDEVPQKINWKRKSHLIRESKVFAGGSLAARDNRLVFSSEPNRPLFVIFYEGSEKDLSIRAVRAGRHNNEYFNFLTPYAFILGAFSQIIIAITNLPRPTHRKEFIAALIALFTPLLPWIPPGILFSIIYRRLWIQARMYRARRDLAKYPIPELVIDGNPENLVRRYTWKAYMLEIISWILLLCGIGVNILFIVLVILILQ